MNAVRWLPAHAPDLASVVGMLHRLGITGVTDATPDLDGSAVAVLRDEVAPHLRLTLLGTDTVPGELTAGPRKLLLRDHDLPTYAQLRDLVRTPHDRGRPVAIHCVTRESLLLTLAVLDEVGVLAGDRIEHAAVVPAGIADELARLRLAVVTQPGFLRVRGDDYIRDVAEGDRTCLYPYRSLEEAGVPVAASSDAPFGPLDPWSIIRDVRDRTSLSGTVLSAAESVSADTALRGYLSPPDAPGSAPRRVAPGAVADLCLLSEPLAAVLRTPDSSCVRAVFFAGTAVAAGLP